MKTTRFCLLALSASILAAGKAQAVVPSIFIDDTHPDDTVTVGGTDFDTNGGTFSVNGDPLLNGQPLSEAAPITFIGTWDVPLGSGITGARTIYMVENLTPDVISDILDFNFNFVPDTGNNVDHMTINGTFQSDLEDNLGTISGLFPAGTEPVNDIFVEASIPTSFSNALLTGQIASDLEQVPEPSTWAACGFVALMAGGTLYRRFRR